MLQITNTSEVMPTLLQGKIPTLLQGRVSLLTGQVSLLGDGKVALLGDANTDVLQQFLAMLLANPDAVVILSKSGNGSGAGSTGGEAGGLATKFLVIPVPFWNSVSHALVAAGNSVIKPTGLGPEEQFIPDAGSRLLMAATLTPIVKSAIQTLGAGGMSTKAKVLLGVGAVAVIGGVALMAFGHGHTHRSLAGARRRRRR
jgi:hypothetical protein